jgi:peptidyl-dipeptidase A
VEDPSATSFYGRKEAGAYLRSEIFAPGNLYPWNDLTKRAMGEPLSPKYFVQQFIRDKEVPSGKR